MMEDIINITLLVQELNMDDAFLVTQLMGNAQLVMEFAA